MKIANNEIRKIEDLAAVSTADLLAFFNETTGKATKKFASRAKAEAQVWGLIAGAVEEELRAEEQAAEAAPAVEAEKKDRKTRGFRFKFCRCETIKSVKEGSKRHKLLQLLKSEGGATFEECMAETGWNRKDCYEGIRLLHYYVGYGLNMDETTGKIWIVE